MKPRLREVEAQSIRHQGEPWVLLRDPLHLSDGAIAVPRPLAPLLGLMDGTRDEAALEAALVVRTGVRLAPGLLSKLLTDLDEAYLLENDHFVAARTSAVRAWRAESSRPSGLDGSGFPTDPDQAAAQLQSYVDALPPPGPAAEDRPIRGVVSPHIDYQRGGPVYAQVWRAATQAAREAELVVIFGTDHQGSNGTLTLTPQSYATPWGVLPTDGQIIDALATVLGEEAAFAEELHHRDEHSIELTAVWLHYVRDGQPVPIVPILCGSFARFVSGEGDPATYGPFAAALDVLREVLATRRTLVVAAADLAHMGPAFGHSYGLDGIAQAQMRNADERLLETVHAGDGAAFFEELKAEGDRRNVCGLPPIYLTLRLLEGATGEPAGYALCPADLQGTSFVTIAGVIFL